MDNNQWHGYGKEEFIFKGKKAIVVFPKHSDSKKNWALKTEYWDAFPETEIALLEKGFHVAYLQNISRFATREDCDNKEEFAKYLQQNYGLRDKCVLIGLSCGGAHAFNFAGYYPKRISCIFADAPVLNFCSYPGNFDSEDCRNIWENEFVKAYPGIKRADLLGSDIHPLCKAHTIMKYNIPVILVYGTEDRTVIYSENGMLLEDIYKEYDKFTVLRRNLQGHHPHGFPTEPAKIPDLIIQKMI